MKKAILFGVVMLFTLVASAQVSLSAKVFLPDKEPLDSAYFIYQLCLIVDGEDTVRHLYTSNDPVRFDNISIGSRCHFIFNDFVNSFDSPTLTITGDTHIDSLVLRRTHNGNGWFNTKTQKDSTLTSDAIQWSHDVNGHDTIWFDDSRNSHWVDDEPHSLKLACLYYYDWVEPLVSWRTWIHAADSAFRYCMLAYKQYPYLYYPLRQLAHHLGKTLEINAPKDPDEYTYVPQPEMPDKWWTDTTTNVLYSWRRYDERNNYERNYAFGKAYEKSLCHPLASDGTMRFMESDVMGWGVLIYRIEDGKLYHKRVSVLDNELKDNMFCTLTTNELDSLSMALNAFQRAGRPDDESGAYVIDGSHFVLEYVIDGHYHRYTTSSGAVPPQLEAIQELLMRFCKRWSQTCPQFK
ncbi:MAG: hypothetical protein MJZ97_10325 [Bacteroidales bacterium]|nr:hypothetical protein [Bacteroidales bacterium]